MVSPQIYLGVVTATAVTYAEGIKCKPKACNACMYDFNHDSQVNFFDLAELANNWRELCSQPGWCGGMDLSNSGRVNFSDMAIFAQEWLLAGI